MLGLDWNSLRIVLAVSRKGSLTGAAAQLRLDQTTVGRKLSAVEQEIGALLFRRAKTGFVVTRAGEIVVEAAKEVEHRLEEMSQSLIPDEEAHEGIVRILGNNWMLAELTSKALPQLLDRYPKLEVRLNNRLPPVPIYGEPTIALWFDADPSTFDQSRPIAHVPFAAYSSATAEPGGNDWVIFRDDDATGPSFTRVIERKLGPDARIRMTGTDASHLAAAIRAGLGHGFLPVCIGDADERLKRSDRVPDPIARILHVHSSPEFEGRVRQRAVLDWLRETLCPALMARPV